MISVMPRILKDDPTAQEFVNELNIAEDYKEPAKRKYDNRSQFDFLIVLFEYVLQALFLCRYRSCIFPFWTPEMERKEWK